MPAERIPVLPSPHNAAFVAGEHVPRGGTTAVRIESGVVSPLPLLDRDAYAAVPPPALHPQLWHDRRLWCYHYQLPR